MSFTTSAKVKAALRIPAGVTQHDAAISDFVDHANRTVLQEIGLAGVTEQSYTETFDVEDAGTSELLLRYRPVRSIVAVVDGGSTLAATDYAVTEYGALRLLGAAADRAVWYGPQFSVGRQTVSVQYRAGFTNAGAGAVDGLPPPDLAHAATMIACQAWNETPVAGLSDQQIGPYRKTPRPPDQGGAWGATVDRILGKYRLPFARS